MRRLGLAVITFLVAVGAVPTTQASIALDTYPRETIEVPAGAPLLVVVEVPFHLTQDGWMYAKALVTPGNPINEGTANGTVGTDGRGVSGWWIEFALADGEGAPLGADADGTPVPTSFGAFVDTTPTPKVRLTPDTPYILTAAIHMPASGAVNGTSYRIPFALAFTLGPTNATTSGGSLDPSRGYTVTLVVGGGTSAPAAPTPTTPDDVVPTPEPPGTPVGQRPDRSDGGATATPGGDVIVQVVIPENVGYALVALGAAALALLFVALLVGASAIQTARRIRRAEGPPRRRRFP